MRKPTHLIEYETMLLGRHQHVTGPRPRREGGRLDRSAYTLLSRLGLQGPMSIGELSEAFRLDPSTLNRQTSAMLHAGLVERIPDPDAGLARKFRITDEGRRGLDEERARLINGIDKIVADWSPQDVTAFADYLRRFNTDIERLTDNPWPRP